MSTDGTATSSSVATTNSKQIELASVCFSKGRKLWNAGNHEEALGLFRKALAIQESVLGTYHKATAKTYYWIGFALKNKQEYDKALVAYRRALRIRTSLAGGGNNLNDVSISDAKRALQDVLIDNEQFSAATLQDGDNKTKQEKMEEYFQEIIDSVQQEAMGSSLEVQGQYTKAVEEYMKCLSIEEKAIGRFPLDIGRMYAKIGGIHKKEEEPEMAITAYREALFVYESTLGKNHPDSLACINGIEASAYQKGLEEVDVSDYCKSVYESIWHTKQGDGYYNAPEKEYEKALEEYQAAIDIEESFLGKYALSAAGIYNRMAAVFSSMGSHDRAILAQRTVLTIYIFECGSDHPTVLRALKHISTTMKERGYSDADVNKYMNTVSYSVKYERYGEHIRKEGEYSEALEEFQKSLALEQSALGKYHLTQAALFRSIGNAFSGQGKFDHAIVNYRQALGIYLTNLGENHFDTKSTLKRIGYAAEDKGMSETEVEAYKDATCKSIGIERTADELSKENTQSLNTELIISTYLRAIDLEVASMGQFNLCTANMHNKIAITLKDSKHHDRAIVKFRDVLAMYYSFLGMDHPNSQKAKEEIKAVAKLKGMDEGQSTAYSLNAIESIRCVRNGDEKRMSGLYDKAATDYNRAIELEEAALGKSHLSTASIQQKLADIYRLKGQFKRAILLNRKVMRLYHDNSVPDHGDGGATTHTIQLTLQGLGFSAAHAEKYAKVVRETLRCEANGDSASKSRNYLDALSEYRRAVALEESLLGKLPLTTADLYYKIACICRDKNDFQSAIVLYSKALAIQESHIGKESEETIRTYNDLLNVTQKEVAIKKSYLDGWMTLNYVLTGLIGLLVLITTLTKSLSAKQKSVHELSLTSLQDEIEDEEELLARAAGRDPDVSPTSVTARSIPFSARRKSNDPPQWGQGGEPDAAKFAEPAIDKAVDGSMPNEIIPEDDNSREEMRKSNHFHARKFAGEPEVEEAAKSVVTGDMPEGVEAESRERRQSGDFNASRFDGGPDVDEDEDTFSQLSSEIVLDPDLVRRFRSIQSERQWKTNDQGMGKPSNSSTQELPSPSESCKREESKTAPGGVESQEKVPYSSLFAVTDEKAPHFNFAPQKEDATNPYDEPQQSVQSSVELSDDSTTESNPENGDKSTKTDSKITTRQIQSTDPGPGSPMYFKASTYSKNRNAPLSEDEKPVISFADKLEFARKIEKENSRRKVEAAQTPSPSVPRTEKEKQSVEEEEEQKKSERRTFEEFQNLGSPRLQQDEESEEDDNDAEEEDEEEEDEESSSEGMTSGESVEVSSAEKSEALESGDGEMLTWEDYQKLG